MQKPKKSLIRRQLGFIETNMALMHECANGTTQGAISVCLDYRVDLNLFKAAVGNVFRSFPILRCNLVELEGGLYFYEDAALQDCLHEPIFTESHSEWASIEEAIVHQPITATTHLWAGRLAYSHDRSRSKIILLSHHALFDAQGATTVFNALLTYLDNPEKTIDSPPPHSSIAPALDSYLMAPDEVAAPTANASDHTIPYEQQCDLSDRATRFHRLEVDNAIIETIKSHGMAEAVSDQALISSAYVLAILDVDAQTPLVDLKTAVALREIIADNEDLKDAVSCYLGICESQIRREDLSVMDVARSIHVQNLNYVIEQCLHRRGFSLRELRDRAKSLCNNNHFSGYALTNVGRLPIKATCDGHPVGGLKIFTNRVIGNYAITLQILELDSYTAFDFIYVTPLMDPQRVKKIANAFSHHLDYLCELGQSFPERRSSARLSCN